MLFAVVALAVAAVRFFLRGLLAPLGVPTVVGSFLASITVVLLLGTGAMFHREANASNGKFIRAAGWTILLSAWCQILIISGILLTESLHADTYFAGPWQLVEELYPSPTAHAIGHTQGFFVLTLLLLIIGGAVYAIARRRRAYAN